MYDIATNLEDTYEDLAQTVFDENREPEGETIDFEIINARWEYLENMFQVNRIIKCFEALETILFLLGRLNVSILKRNHKDSEYAKAYDCLHRSVHMLMILCIKESRPDYKPHQINKELELITEYWFIEDMFTMDIG